MKRRGLAVLGMALAPLLLGVAEPDLPPTRIQVEVLAGASPTPGGLGVPGEGGTHVVVDLCLNS